MTTAAAAATTAATGAATTDPTTEGTDPRRSARPTSRPGVSVRVRITAAVALLGALALTGAGAIVYAVEGQRVEEQQLAEIDQELAELGKLHKRGLNPDTGRPFDSVGTMLDTFLVRNVPDENEILVSWFDGRPQKASPTAAFAETQLFRDTAGALVDDGGGSARVDVPGYGEALITVQPVRSTREAGALVIVTYLTEARAELRDTMRTYATVALLSLLLVTAAAAWLSGRLLAPLRTLRETADDISGSDLSRRLPVTGHDDITALTRTVNGMLDRLEAAFVGQREFLDDAGHELRTPLTVLRGHLELLDTGDPAEVAETKELLLDEVDRMSRLVGDLILLAKSDRPDFLQLRPVDLAGLTADVLAKARGLGDRDWQLDAAADVVVVGDEQRLTQALLQLADNAVKHTGPGDTVAIGSSYDDGRARLWVRDTGPGVPPEQRGLIFERFGRGAVMPGDEGFGLGLSIVSAIARSHGGGVEVEDAEETAPRGARFVMTLPAPPKEDPWPGS
ncbi:MULTISPECIES: HAMP domain-containing sensor histidine kinase [unclassified Nocardioides]|uniref:sensor histidine kinase n=1 Tax=unclassified Nocardioides TaxID=2615069 RepID=UPI0000571E7A|nr:MULTISPECIES: HAMP domain-containing sensor histidine kinase [unclassified Nocardioides]ABL81517.1 ATP-binding region, ATPase domain protein [Nocardioides sp. JS614]